MVIKPFLLLGLAAEYRSGQGWFAIYGLALSTVNLPAKFEVSNSIH